MRTENSERAKSILSFAKESEERNLRLQEFFEDDGEKFSNQANARSKFAKQSDIFTEYGQWTEHLVYTAIATAMQICLGHAWAYPDGVDATTGKACGKTLPSNMNSSMCGLELSLESAQGQLQFLTAFVLGGFVVSTVAQWRARRTAYLALCGATRNLNVNIASILPLPTTRQTATKENDRQMRQILYTRHTLARWSLLGFELSVLKARGQIDMPDYAVPHLNQLFLLADGEWQSMVPGDRHTTVWLWMQTMAVQLANEGIVSNPIHVQTLCNAIALIRDRANDLMSSLDRDQPFPYVSICGLLVNLNLLLNALWKGTEWARWFFEQGGSVYGTPKMYIEVFILLVTSMLFGMLYDLLHILYNPFGSRPIDLPHVAVGGGIRKMARAFASGDFLPPTLDLNNGGNHEGNDFSRSTTSQQQPPLENIPEEFEDDEFDSILEQTRDHLYAPPSGSIFAALGRGWSSKALEY